MCSCTFRVINHCGIKRRGTSLRNTIWSVILNKPEVNYVLTFDHPTTNKDIIRPPITSSRAGGCALNHGVIIRNGKKRAKRVFSDGVSQKEVSPWQGIKAWERGLFWMRNQTFYCCISTVETRAALLLNIYGSSLKWPFVFCRKSFLITVWPS